MSPARVLCVALDATPSVAQVLRCLRDDAHPFALVGAWGGGGAVVGSEPVVVSGAGDDPFALLDRQPAVEGSAGDGFVGGGWVGYLGNELRARIGDEPASPPPPRPLPLPDGALAFYDHVLRCDASGAWWFEALVTPEREAAVAARLGELRERLAAPAFGVAGLASIDEWAWTPSLDGHGRAVAACIERIRAGDLYQANLTLRLDGRLHGDALDLFLALNEALPTDHAAFVSGPWGALVSLSPELYLERRGRRVRSAPIKGTRPHPDDPAAAEEQRRALAESAKDRAENVMIVDLVRNDLGRVCRPGSVRVDVLGEVRAHAGVWHMVSEVGGELRDGVGDGELVRATFPPGSVTGAPKVAAMAVIAELESTGREAYTGAIGICSPVAGLELSVAIRTLEISGDRVWLGVGGGIVADSDPAAEGREALGKAAPILAALGGAQPVAVATRGPAVARLGPRPLARPDPAAGVFETLLVGGGEALHLDDHLERLRRSLATVYGAALPATLAARARDAAADCAGPASMNITATPEPGGDRIDVEVVVRPLGARSLAPPPALAAVVVPGGIGCDKWIDRALLDALDAEHAPALPLLVDLDGALLETTRANVFLLIGGRLLTPPLDGRILPGIARAHVLRTTPDAAEARLTLDDLAIADAVLITNALRGLQTVRPRC